MTTKILFYLLILSYVISKSAKESLDEKLEKIQGKLSKESGAAVIELTDDEIEYLVFNTSNDWLILFYDGELNSSGLLIATWNFAARNLFEKENMKVPMCKVNLRNYKRSFHKFRLYDYPAAIYIHDGHYYNITKPFKLDPVISLVKDKTYQNYVSHKLPSLSRSTWEEILKIVGECDMCAFLIGFVATIMIGFSYRVLSKRGGNKQKAE